MDIAAPAAPKTLTPGQLGAVAVGNALEFYDFGIFGYFAIQIGHAFFPVQGGNTSLLLSLATFASGFAMRPLGGIVIGRMGDRLGRRPAMILSFALMGASMVGMALTPSYASIGIAAPLPLVFFRMVQGFALGGEAGPTTAFLLEVAPPHRRGLYVSLQFATQRAAALVSGLIGLALASVLSDAALTQWGWRIAFLLGAVIVPLGLVMRSRLPETFSAEGGSPRQLPTRAQLRLALLGLMLMGGTTVSVYMMNYLTTFASNTLGLPARIAFGATVIGGFCGLVFSVLGGLLSDRLGRRAVILAALGLLLLVAVPCFLAMVALKTPLVLFGAAALLSSLIGLGLAPIYAVLPESLPPHLRSGMFGIVYAVATSLFGGTAQFMVTWLIGVTGSPVAPAWYMTALLVMAFAGAALGRESAPARSGSRNSV